MAEPFRAAADVTVIPTLWPLPSGSVLPLNAFVLHAAEPVLVDAGAGALSAPFLAALASVLPLDSLRWIWVTHEDLDHTGSVRRLLDLAPRARVVTSSATATRLSFSGSLPADRLHTIGSGQTLHVGDRTLGALRPPLFDSPATTGFLDRRSGALFSSDCFGASLPGMEEASARSVAELPPEMVRANQVSWSHTDSPWVTTADEGELDACLQRVQRLRPSTILSAHLVPIHEAEVPAAIATLRHAARAEPSAGVTQPELESLLASFES